MYCLPSSFNTSSRCINSLWSCRPIDKDVGIDWAITVNALVVYMFNGNPSLLISRGFQVKFSIIHAVAGGYG
jgi:hypothetical protein